MKKILLMLFMILMIGSVSAAWEWDNVKDYDEAKKEITVDNALGLGDTIAKITLNTPQTLNVMPGKDRLVAEFTINNYDDYNNIFNEMEFYDINNNMNRFERKFTYKIKNSHFVEVPISERQCSQRTNENGSIESYNCKKVQIGVTIDERNTWTEFDKKLGLNKGNITIGIFTDVLAGDNVEWIPTLFGVRINEWATWNDGFHANLKAYFNFSGSSLVDIHSGVHNGTISNTVNFEVGKTGNAVSTSHCTSGGGCGYITLANPASLNFNNSEPVSVSFWAISDGNWGYWIAGNDGVTGVINPMISFLNLEYSGGVYAPALRVRNNGGTDSQAYSNNDMVTGSWQHIVITYAGDGNASNIKIYVNGNVSETTTSGGFTPDGGVQANVYLMGGGQYYSIGGKMDEIAIWQNRIISSSEVTDLYNNGAGIFYENEITSPIVTLSVPTNNTAITTTSLLFNCSAEDNIGVINVSLILNNVTNFTVTNTTAGEEVSLQTTVTNLGEGIHTWTCNASDESDVSTGELRSFTVDTTPNIDFENPTPIDFINISTNTFQVNITTNEIFFLNVTFELFNSSGIFNTTVFTDDTRIINYSSIPDGTYTYNVTVGTTTGVTNTTEIRTITIDVTAPIVSVIAPRGEIDSHVTGNNLTLNWSVIDINLDACWFEYNETNTTVNCGDNNFSFIIDKQQNLTFYANDTFGNQGSNFTSWAFAFVENNITFNGNVSETSSQFFELNVTTSLTILSITSNLNYNGTKHLSTANCIGGNCLLSNTIDIPLVEVGESQTNPFFWEISIFNGTESININTSTRDQNVSRIHLETCDATFTTIALNFTAQQEVNLTRVNPFRFDGTFDFWLGGGSVKRNNSFNNASTDEVNLCITPNEPTSIDAQIEYNEPTNVTFVTRNYYFQNDTISNVTQHIPLFLLASDDATTFILKVQDDELLALPEHIILIQRFYPGENIFRTVQVARTDDNGKSLGFFEVEIPDYRFIIKKDGIVLLTTSKQKIFPETSPFTLTFTIGADLGTPWGELEDLPDLTFTLDFNKTNNIITYTYVDTNTTFSLGRLIVQKQNFSFNTPEVICDVNSSLSSAALICDVGTITGNDTGAYTASGVVVRDGNSFLISVKNFLLETISSIMGLLGVFMAFFIIFISSFAFKFNEIAGIFMINAAIIFVNLIGLVSFGMLSITAIIAVSIVIAAVIEK